MWPIAAWSGRKMCGQNTLKRLSKIRGSFIKHDHPAFQRVHHDRYISTVHKRCEWSRLPLRCSLHVSCITFFCNPLPLSMLANKSSAQTFKSLRNHLATGTENPILGRSIISCGTYLYRTCCWQVWERAQSGILEGAAWSGNEMKWLLPPHF